MKTEQFKQIIKPLIKQCIKEILLEEQGVLSHIIKEVISSHKPILSEQQQHFINQAIPIKGKSNNLNSMTRDFITEQQQELNEHKKKLTEALNKKSFGGVDVFEGLTPIPTAKETPSGGNNNMGALKDIDPGDPGIDITGLMNLSGKKWSVLK